MNKKTQMWIGVVAIAGVTFWLLNKDKSKDKVFSNASGRLSRRAASAPGCVIYEGSCNSGVGTIIHGWIGGTKGIIVANDSNHCIVCPVSQTPTGMPDRV